MPSQEIGDNPDANHEQEAEPSVTRDPAPIPLDSEVEGGAWNARNGLDALLHGLAISLLAVI